MTKQESLSEMIRTLSYETTSISVMGEKGHVDARWEKTFGWSSEDTLLFQILTVTEVFERVSKSVESIEPFATQLAYLMNAIMTDGEVTWFVKDCQFEENNFEQIYSVFLKEFSPKHKVWEFIQFKS